MILRELHLDTRIKRGILMKVVVPKLEYAEVCEGDAKLVNKLETVAMTAAKKILGCSKTANKTALIESRIGDVLIKNRDMRTSK